MNERVRVEPATEPWLSALADGDDVFTARLGIPVEPGWAVFPESIPFALAGVRAGDDPAWGFHLFFDGEDGALVGLDVGAGPLPVHAGGPGRRSGRGPGLALGARARSGLVRLGDRRNRRQRMGVRTGVRKLFTFPNPVNEVSARLVAGGVVLMALMTIAFDQPWLTLVIAYGFVARVLTGPTLSPLGQFVTRVVTPRLGVEPRNVAGPPKRFAQGIGAVFSVTAAVLALGFGARGASYAVLGLLVVAATLESVFGYCIGCRMFGLLMKIGVIPDEVCERCNNIALGAPVR